MYICITESLCCTVEITHYIVNQLYFSKIDLESFLSGWPGIIPQFLLKEPHGRQHPSHKRHHHMLHFFRGRNLLSLVRLSGSLLMESWNVLKACGV